jgi:hypothetical protein
MRKGGRDQAKLEGGGRGSRERERREIEERKRKKEEKKERRTPFISPLHITYKAKN